MAHHFATQRTNRSQSQDIIIFQNLHSCSSFQSFEERDTEDGFHNSAFPSNQRSSLRWVHNVCLGNKNILSSTFWYELSSEDTKVHAEFRPCVHVRLLEQHDPAHHLHRHCHRDQGSFSQVGPIYFLGFNDIADFFIQRTTIFDLSTIHMVKSKTFTTSGLYGGKRAGEVVKSIALECNLNNNLNVNNNIGNLSKKTNSMLGKAP